MLRGHQALPWGSPDNACHWPEACRADGGQERPGEDSDRAQGRGSAESVTGPGIVSPASKPGMSPPPNSTCSFLTSACSPWRLPASSPGLLAACMLSWSPAHSLLPSVTQPGRRRLALAAALVSWSEEGLVSELSPACRAWQPSEGQSGQGPPPGSCSKVVGPKAD